MSEPRINIITSPTVRVVARQTIDEPALAAFLADEGAPDWTTDTPIDPQRLVEAAGRACYSSYSRPRPGGNAAYLGHILEVGHGSVTEHAVWSFIITGVSRSLTHELIRHRAGWAYSQRSQRFCDESNIAVVVPPGLEAEVRAAQEFIARFGDPAPSAIDAMNYVLKHQDIEDYANLGLEAGVGLQWLAQMEMVQNTYKAISGYLIEKMTDYAAAPGAVRPKPSTSARKQAREAARSVLPNATATEIFATANTRAIRTMLEQRGAREADAEIRRFAVATCRIMLDEAPNLFADFSIESDDDGSEYLTCKYHKV